MKNSTLNTSKILGLFLVALFLLNPVSMHAQNGATESAQETDKKPIGWMRSHRLGAPLQPVYAKDIRQEIYLVSKATDQITSQVKQVRLDPNSREDDIRRLFEDALPLEKHNADINEIRDRLTLCMAGMETKQMEAKDAGELSGSEEKVVAGCMEHCEKVVTQLNKVHHNTAILRRASRKAYILNAWNEHRTMMAELQKLMSECPMEMTKALNAFGPDIAPPTDADHSSHEQ